MRMPWYNSTQQLHVYKESTKWKDEELSKMVTVYLLTSFHLCLLVSTMDLPLFSRSSDLPFSLPAFLKNKVHKKQLFYTKRTVLLNQAMGTLQ